MSEHPKTEKILLGLAIAAPVYIFSSYMFLYEGLKEFGVNQHLIHASIIETSDLFPNVIKATSWLYKPLLVSGIFWLYLVMISFLNRMVQQRKRRTLGDSKYITLIFSFFFLNIFSITIYLEGALHYSSPFFLLLSIVSFFSLLLGKRIFSLFSLYAWASMLFVSFSGMHYGRELMKDAVAIKLENKTMLCPIFHVGNRIYCKTESATHVYFTKDIISLESKL